MRINFNVPPFTGREMIYIKQAVDAQKICGDGQFTAKCNKWIEDKTGCEKALLTTSCTHATELAALLADIRPGDEVVYFCFDRRCVCAKRCYPGVRGHQTGHHEYK